MGIPPRLPWQMLWPYRRRIYLDWLFWSTIAVTAIEIQVNNVASLVIGWGYGAVWILVALVRWWKN